MDNSEIQSEAQQNKEDLKKILPFFKSWGQVYAFVLAELAVLIILFYLFSSTFA